VSEAVAPVVVAQSLVVQPAAQWGLYPVPRDPEAFVPIDLWLSSAAYFEPGSMRASVNGNVVRVDFDYLGNAPVSAPGVATRKSVCAAPKLGLRRDSKRTMVKIARRCCIIDILS